MTIRILILMLCFLSASVYIANVPKAESPVDRQLLKQFPVKVGTWEGWDAAPLDARVVAALGVDDHLNRLYVSQNNVIGAYIGYYASQREGDAIHSPMNCLPGAGWNPVDRSLVKIAVASGPEFPADREIEVNRVTIQK